MTFVPEIQQSQEPQGPSPSLDFVQNSPPLPSSLKDPSLVSFRPFSKPCYQQFSLVPSCNSFITLILLLLLFFFLAFHPDFYFSPELSRLVLSIFFVQDLQDPFYVLPSLFDLACTASPLFSFFSSFVSSPLSSVWLELSLIVHPFCKNL